MSVRSGRLSSVNGQTTVQQWAANLTTDPRAFGASNTSGGTGRRVGNLDWTGSFRQLTGLPAIMPNDEFTFTGYIGDDLEDGGKSIGGNVICNSVVITWNWATGDIINTVVNWQGNGAFAFADADGTDATDVLAPPVCPAKVEWTAAQDNTGYAAWDNLTQVVLTISAATQAYTNSSSKITIETKDFLAVKRRKGRIDFTVALTEQNSDGLPSGRFLSDDVALRIFTDATNFWELAMAHVGDATGIVADRDTGAIIQRTQNLGMNAFTLGASAEGRIVKPGGSLYWGTAAA